MAQVNKQVLIEYTPAQMFALVDDVARYPEFLPWCAKAEVLSCTSTQTQARLHIHYHGIRTHFGTLNTKQAPSEMTLKLVEGPFKQLEGLWRFTPLGEHACKIHFQLQYEFSSSMLSKVLNPVFNHIANTFVEAFIERAAVIYR